MVCPICKQDLTIIEKEAKILEDNLPKVNKYALCKFCKKQWKLNKTTKTPKQDEKQIKIVGESESAPPLDVSKLAKLLSLAEDRNTKDQEISRLMLDSLPSDSFQEVDFELEPNRKTSDNVQDREESDKAAPKPQNKNRKNVRPGEKSDNKSKPNPRERGESIAQSNPREKGENLAKSSPRKKGENLAKSSPREKGENLAKSSPKRRGEKKTESSPKKKDENRTESSHEVEEDFGQGLIKKTKSVAMEVKERILKMDISLFRKVVGILSILIFVFFFYHGVTTSELAAAASSIALSIFCLGAGAFQLLTQKNNDTVSFVLPAILYIIGGMIAFLQSEGRTTLLVGAIIPLILAIILVALASLWKMKKI